MHKTLLLLLLPVVVMAAGAEDGQYAGRPVAAVIDEFRAAGEPFAYSTNLVTDDLIVTAEPEPGSAIDIVRQILQPYGLTVETRAGVYLVTRISASGLDAGRILLVVTARNDSRPLQAAAISVRPELENLHRVEAGIFEYTGVAPGRYQFSVEAPGFETAVRIVDVSSGETRVVSVDLGQARPAIETIAVSASRYEILRDIAASRFVLDQRTIQNMPDLGEDPMRIVQRLPGAAASGASAKTYVRGGDEGEIGIMLNGQWLFDPFHVRDYQSVFSAIDARAIEGVEVYTGGFPARFGNRLSGLVLMESMEALKPRHTEVGLSVFNTSFLTAGTEADRHWLVSARRGNLDLVISPEFGEPSYYDVFAEYTQDISPNASLSFNALYSNDRVEIVLEQNPAELERVTSDTGNAQFWLRLDNRWSDELSSRTVLSAVSFSNFRHGQLGDMHKFVGSVSDQRDVREAGFRQDFTLNLADRHLVQWGLNAEFSDAVYDYSSNADYYGLMALYQGQAASVSSAATAAPDGASYSLYVADRWKLSARSLLEWGLRWDDQTYTGNASDSQLSPRLSFLRAVGRDTELRVSWGRYQQSQRIDELQIEDGITHFWPAQRADHLIVGLRHLIRDKLALRIEAFRKDMWRVRPRFENLYDPLALIPELMPDRVRLDPARARARGLEISLEESEGAMNWWATYVWSRVTDRIDGVDQLRSWDQRHGFQGGISWSNSTWDLSAVANIHSGWPTTRLSWIENGVDARGAPLFVAIPGPRNVDRFPTFASFDVRASRKWKLARSSLTAFLEISNLANRRNVCCRDYDLEIDDATGEEYFASDVDHWLPRLPAIGVLWEF